MFINVGIIIFVLMKSARIIVKSNKNLNFHVNGKLHSIASGNRKSSIRNIFAKTPSKISPRIQFLRIKEALKEVQMIKAGIIKPKSLDDLLDEL